MKPAKLLGVAACASAMLLLAACAPSSYAVKHPVPSDVRYVAQSPASTLGLIDQRAVSERTFLTGTLASTLTVDGAPVDGSAFLAKNLQAELAARGVPVQISDAANTFPRIDLKAFRIQNHRQNGYAPYVTFTFISADVETAAGKKRMGVFVKRGKVPVWSFDEIVEPTLNQPLSLAVKELASKIAHHLYGAQSSDGDVDKLVAKLATRNDNSFLDAYALGFTNNAKAIAPLVGLVNDPDEYVRIAAISSLGNLHAAPQLDLLKSIYRDAKLWQDRAMAIKAIGDLDTPESNAFLSEQMTYWKSQPADKESAWTMQVIGLYI